MVKLNLPTRPWVPQWLGIVTMFIVIFPITLLNGAYTGSMVEVSNTLGVLSEDITMAYYSASVGMAVAYPIVPKIRTIATPKTLLLTDLLLQIFFSLVCAKPVVWMSSWYAVSVWDFSKPSSCWSSSS